MRKKDGRKIEKTEWKEERRKEKGKEREEENITLKSGE